MHINTCKYVLHACMHACVSFLNIFNHQTGITADILPGISHEDSLFSDLEIDPYYHGGCQTLGATDFLLFNRQLLTDSHIVMRHVGSIGEQSFSTRGVGLSNLPVLIKQLQKVYGPDYEVIHYYPSQYPTCKPFIDRKPLCEFLKPEILKTFLPFSTLYLPPMKTMSINPTMALQLGLVSDQSAVQQLQLPTKFFGVYGQREKQAISSLSGWKCPATYRPTIRSGASRFLIDISTNPKKLLKYLNNPTKLMKKYAITPAEISSLTSHVPRDILLTVKPHSRTVALAVVRRLCLDPSFASAYSTAANSFYSTFNGEEKLIEWLKLRGYETTPEAIDEKLKEIRRVCYMMWVGNYTTTIPDVTVGIQINKVSVSGVPVKSFAFKDGVMSWSAGDGVVYNGILRFMETPVNTFVGKMWKLNEVEPLVDNIRGEFIPSFGGTWKDLECVMAVGIATNLHVRSLLKFWRAHSQISTGVQQQSSLLPVVVEDIEKTVGYLTSLEALLFKVNPDYKPAVSDDTELVRMGWPTNLTPATMDTSSVFLPHVSTLIV